jgi:toxin FitB
VNGYLLDTNVISELVKSRPNPDVIAWIASTEESSFHLSVLTWGEIRKGIASLEDRTRRELLEKWLNRELAIRFAGRILPIDRAVADRWGQLMGAEQARKQPLPVIDGLLAATALHFDLVLVTRDTKHLETHNVPHLNPWLRGTES